MNYRLMKLLSFLSVIGMISSGVMMIIPISEKVTDESVLILDVEAELGPGPDWGGQDGHWDWGGYPGSERLLSGRGGFEKQTGQHKILLIMDYFSTSADPNSKYDSLYSRLKIMTDDLHDNDVTVDTWYCYPYISGGKGYNEGYYDDIARFNYYPSDDIIEDYEMVMIHCNGAMYGGCYYYYDNDNIQRDTFKTLENYMEDGGTVAVFSYATRYYFTYSTTYIGEHGVDWVRNYLGLARGPISSYTYGYRLQGVTDTMGDNIGPTVYPDDYVVSYGYDNNPILPMPETKACYYSSYRGEMPDPAYPCGWQTNTGTWKSALLPDFWYMRSSNGYIPGIRDIHRNLMVEQMLEFLLYDTCQPSCAFPPIFPTEIQDSGKENEWVEFATSFSQYVNLYSVCVATEPEYPTSFFGGYTDLHEFGTPAYVDPDKYLTKGGHETYEFYLNAESLYIDRYYNDIFLYKDLGDTTNNTYGTVYTTDNNGNKDWTIWYDKSEDSWLDETERDSRVLSELQDVYQITLPDILLVQRKYVSLDGDFETDCTISDNHPGGEVKMLDFIEDGDLDDHVGGFSSETLDGILLDHEFNCAGKTLNYFLDDDVKPYFWRIYVPKVIFVNDNTYPSEHIYYSHIDGKVKDSSDGNTEDIYFPDHLDHYTNEEYFQDRKRTYDGYEIAFRDDDIRSQITTVTLRDPVLNRHVYVDKNTGAFKTGTGSEIVDMNIEEYFDEEHCMWLFPVGSTYLDYNDLDAGKPMKKELPSHIVVKDESDSEDELPENGEIFVYSPVDLRSPLGPGMGWGTKGIAPSPVPGKSAQAYFDGSKYHYYKFNGIALWTLADESKGRTNDVPRPDIGGSSIVINEVNPSYVELYNRGGSTMNVNNWLLTFNSASRLLNGTIGPGDFMVVTQSVPFCMDSGGRVSLLDDLGTLVNTIGYVNDTGEAGDSLSYVARHIDGVGPDIGYKKGCLQPFLRGEEGVQQNEDWEELVPRTPDRRNYDGLTILQVGKSNGQYSLVESLSLNNDQWANGTIGVTSIYDYYLNTWDVVFILDGLSELNGRIVDDYILSGGNLYVEYHDWEELSSTPFSQHIGISPIGGLNENVDTLLGCEPVTQDLELDYTGAVKSRFLPDEDSFPVLQEEGKCYAVMYVNIDTEFPTRSYRAIASSVKYELMSKPEGNDGEGDEPYNYTTMIMEYFLMGDDDINHQPVVELIEPVQETEIPLFKSRPTLRWINRDEDIWDKVNGAMRYSLYIHEDRQLVETMDPSAISAIFLEETSTNTKVCEYDVPSAGTYYWGIFAEDKYGKTTYESGGAFIYDSEAPMVRRISALKGNVVDDPLPFYGDPDMRIFGPAYKNSRNQNIGRPDGFSITLSDNYGLRFSNNHIRAELLPTNDPDVSSTIFSVDIKYYYAGQFSDELPDLEFFVDPDGMDNDLEQLNGNTEITFYMLPNGTLPDGEYTIYVIAGDILRWGDVRQYYFKLDLTPPDAPENFTIMPSTYVDNSGELYLKAGELYWISVNASSVAEDDASMDRVVFQQAVSTYEGTTWEYVGTDQDPGDRQYSVLWSPDDEHRYLRTIAYDEVDNYAVSMIFSDFHVDGTPPERPLTLMATLDLETVVPRAHINGYVYDRIVEDQTSGMDHVVLWMNGEPIVDEDGEVLNIDVNNYEFEHTLELVSVSPETGDIAYSFKAQGFDHVGNAGELSDLSLWTDTGKRESIRIISPAIVGNAVMTEEKKHPDVLANELRSISVTFDTVKQIHAYYPMIIRSGSLRTSSEASNIGLPKGTQFLSGYYTIEVPPDFPDFTAIINIEFNLARVYQSYGLNEEELLDRLRLVTRENDSDTWEVLHLLDHRPVLTGEDGFYRVRCRVESFSDFAIVISRTDLSVKNIILGANPALPGNSISIEVRVHNGADFPHIAVNVSVVLYAIDEDGTETIIGTIYLGSIDPEKDYYTGDGSLKKGEVSGSIVWDSTQVSVQYGDMRTWSIRAEVDPDGHVRETDEMNNQKIEKIEFVGMSSSSPSFALYYSQLLLTALMISTLSACFMIKRDEKEMMNKNSRKRNDDHGT